MSKAKQEQVEPMELEAWDFSADEKENQGEVANPYFTRLGKFIRAVGNKFEMVDTATGQIVWTKDKLEAAIAYSHSSAKLYQGLWTGTAAAKHRKDWTEEESEVLAMCYDHPKRTNTPGAFAMYMDALKVKGKVRFRNWLWLYLPADDTYAVLTVGPSSIGSFGAMVQAYQLTNRPLTSAWVTEVTLETAKTDEGEIFFRPTFKATKRPSAVTKDEWKAKVGDFAAVCRMAHVEASAQIERQAARQGMLGTNVAPRAQLAAPAATVVADPFAEGMPTV